MLSEHTLKAINIVCEEFDAEFKEKVTKHLEWFYKRMQEGSYSNQYGLCFNLEIMLSSEDFFVSRTCSSVLSKSFEIAGLCAKFPFNNGSSGNYHEENYNMYHNPKRIAWIADNVNGSQQC